MFKKGNTVVIKDNNRSFEKYQHAVRNKEFEKLKTHSEHFQQSNSRYALVDYLVDKFHWDYWLVVVFGFNPQEDQVKETLKSSHYHFDRWLLTNNKLSSIPVDARSRWVCCPEKGSGGNLHYNCFLELRTKPNVKTYETEWNAVRIALRNIFRKLQKGLTYRSDVDFRLYERGRKIEDLRTAQYSTKEMRQQWMNDHGDEDHFANTILSWVDWGVIPITKRSPKKYSPLTIPRVGALDQFMV